MSRAIARAQYYKETNTSSGVFSSLKCRDLSLHFGGSLDVIDIEYALHGDINKPIIAVLGGISANRNVADSKLANGWWNELTLEGRALDLKKYCLVSINYIAPNESVLISSHDQAKALKTVLDYLSVKKLEAFVGSSYGGLVGQSFAALYPKYLDKLICVCASAKHSNHSIAQRGLQRKILNELEEHGNLGIIIARSFALLGYRGQEELETRFNNTPNIKEQSSSFEILDYIDYNAKKFAQSFDAKRYSKLSESIDLHQVSLSKIKCDSLFIAFDSDQIVPHKLVQETANAIENGNFKMINTAHGHDAFLIEYPKLSNAITLFLGKKT